MKRFWYGLLAAAVLAAGWLICWYAQSPVSSGIYPARLGGTIFTDGRNPEFDLPMIWVRPYPWAAVPPVLHFGALVGPEGDTPRTMNGEWRPDIAWEPRTRPAWLQPRTVQGTVRLPYPQDGMTVQGVRWQVGDQPAQTYRTGPLKLAWAPQTGGPVRFGGGTYQYAYPWDEPGKQPDYSRLVGHYLYVDGPGRLVDLIPSLAGTSHPPDRALYREGTVGPDGLTGRHYEDPAYRPLTLPLEISSAITIYLPLPAEAQARITDTYYYWRPAAVFETSDGRRETVLSWYRETGIRASRREWRYWVPYFVYAESRQGPEEVAAQPR